MSIINSIIIKILSVVRKILSVVGAIINRIILFLKILTIYFSKKECVKYRDCVLLGKLLYKQPPGSDRLLEYPWMLENIDIKSGKLLDVGSTAYNLLRDYLPENVEIYALDLNDKKINKSGIQFLKNDIRKTNFADDYFDLTACISTLEHIGISGRYDSDHDPDGDFKAIREIKRILKPNGRLLLTVPYGKKDVLPINRLYRKDRLDKILAGWQIISITYKKFNKNYRIWLKVNEEEAAKTDMISDNWYAICFINAIKK